MDKLRLARDTAAHALQTLDEVLQVPLSTIVRDAAIQRFEYTFETVWKMLRAYLLERHGIDAGSPKACFREALKAGVLTSEQTEHGLMMTDDRNLTSHTYIEAVATAVFSRLGSHAVLMRTIVEKVS